MKACCVIASTLFLYAPLTAQEIYQPEICYSLTNEERDRIWMEMHFCIKKMHYCLENAEREASYITNIDIEQATRAAITGAITGLTTRNIYGVAISVCLNTLGTIAGDFYIGFRNARDYVRSAEYFARRADELQERLWMDE